MKTGYKLPDLVIPNSGSESNVLDEKLFQHASYFIIATPAAKTGTITLSISIDKGVSYQTLQSAGADIEFDVSKAVVVLAQGFDKIKMASSSAEAAERTYKIKAVDEVIDF